MSRIGKQPITIPTGVSVAVADSPLGTTVTVKGREGELSRLFRPAIVITAAEDRVTLSPRQPALSGALWGTYASHIRNMIRGASAGFAKQLVIEGIGYKGAVAGQTLTLNVGFSHPVIMTAPAGVKILLEKNLLTVSGPD